MSGDDNLWCPSCRAHHAPCAVPTPVADPIDTERKAREALAAAPRCPRVVNLRRCRLTDGHVGGCDPYAIPAHMADNPWEHLRAALAEVDRLTAALAEARAELENEHGKGDGPSFGWACRGGEWEKTEDDYLSVRRLDTYSVRWEVWRLDECIAAGSAETFRAGMRAADRATKPTEAK